MPTRCVFVVKFSYLLLECIGECIGPSALFLVEDEDVRQTSEVPDAASVKSSAEWQSSANQTANKCSNSVIDSSQDDDLGKSLMKFVNFVVERMFNQQASSYQLW